MYTLSWIETRKIIRVGEKSYAITIPKKWANLLGLKPGSSVDILFDKSGIIYIRPRKLGVKRDVSLEASLKIGECGTIIDKCISGCYIEGHDTIVLELPSNTVLVSEVSSKLPGVVIVEGEDNKVIVKIAISESIIGFEEVVNRMIKVLETMYDYIEEFIEKNDEKSASELLKSDDELDRLFFLGLRLAKRSIITRLLEGDLGLAKELIDSALLIRAIEHVGDALDRSTRILLDSGFNGMQSKLVELFRLSRKIIFDALAAYRRANIKMACKVLERRRELRQMIRSLRRDAAVPIQGVLSELDLIAALAEDITDIAVSRYTRLLVDKKKTPSS